MVKLTKIYTKTGDTGTTSLVGGSRINKAERRIEVIGIVDELNAHCGLACVAMNRPVLQAWRNNLLRVQQELFNLGAQLATMDPDIEIPVISANAIERLETEIDTMNTTLLPLNSFILPGGGEAAARLHVARTVCRRAEQVLWQLARTDTVDAQCLMYLNRLSDWLFVLARAVGKVLGEDEVLWDSRR